MPGFAIPRSAQPNSAPGWKPGARVAAEYYPTPPAASRALLSVEQFDGSIWEPACGDGRLARVLAARGHFVVSTDLHDYGAGEAGIDFLAQTVPRARNIVTNPPYGRGLADRFIDHALDLTASTGGKVAMLLCLSSLCHPVRTERWRARPPARLYGLDECVCWDDGRFGPAPWRTPKQRFVWAVWEPGHTGPAAFWWLSTRTLR